MCHKKIYRAQHALIYNVITEWFSYVYITLHWKNGNMKGKGKSDYYDQFGGWFWWRAKSPQTLVKEWNWGLQTKTGMDFIVYKQGRENWDEYEVEGLQAGKIISLLISCTKKPMKGCISVLNSSAHKLIAYSICVYCMPNPLVFMSVVVCRPQ